MGHLSALPEARKAVQGHCEPGCLSVCFKLGEEHKTANAYRLEL